MNFIDKNCYALFSDNFFAPIEILFEFVTEVILEPFLFWKFDFSGLNEDLQGRNPGRKEPKRTRVINLKQLLKCWKEIKTASEAYAQQCGAAWRYAEGVVR